MKALQKLNIGNISKVSGHTKKSAYMYGIYNSFLQTIFIVIRDFKFRFIQILNSNRQGI